MANTYIRLMEPMVITGNATQDPARTVRVGAFYLVYAHLRVLSTDTNFTAGDIYVQHAAHNSEDDNDWHDIFTRSITSVGATPGSSGSDSFMQFLRWQVRNTAGAGSSVVTVELILKNT